MSDQTNHGGLTTPEIQAESDFSVNSVGKAKEDYTKRQLKEVEAEWVMPDHMEENK